MKAIRYSQATPPHRLMRAGSYWSAVGRAVGANEPSELWPFVDRGVIDTAGRFHPFEVDLSKLYRLAHTGGESFEQIYNFTS